MADSCNFWTWVRSALLYWAKSAEWLSTCTQEVYHLCLRDVILKEKCGGMWAGGYFVNKSDWSSVNCKFVLLWSRLCFLRPKIVPMFILVPACVHTKFKPTLIVSFLLLPVKFALTLKHFVFCLCVVFFCLFFGLDRTNTLARHETHSPCACTSHERTRMHAHRRTCRVKQLKYSLFHHFIKSELTCLLVYVS